QGSQAHRLRRGTAAQRHGQGAEELAARALWRAIQDLTNKNQGRAMDLQLKGKTAVVTGGTRGIGRSIADLFADEGANVAICARNADQVAETVKALEGKGVKAFGEVVDIADGPALQGFIRKAGETLGGIDVLVSNASALVQGN